MIGKIRKFNFTSLFFVILLALTINSFIFKDYFFVVFFLSSFFISFLATKYGLEIIKKLNILQSIREEGPSLHLSKKNTPTMGGIFFILPFLIMLFFIKSTSENIGLSLLFFITLSFFIIGFFDDYLSISKKENTGLKSTEKFLLQAFFAIIFILLAYKQNYINSSLIISKNLSIETNSIIFPISFVTLVGLSNAVNLTDGLDGLASGCSAIVFFGLGTEIMLKEQNEFVVFGLLCYSMAGLCMGFLKYNKFPAKIFMGDTGSLTIGASLGAISILTNSYFFLFIISGIFFIEALSVIIQVGFYKTTKKLHKKGKRIFLMTPIHHHFELKGIKEEKIVENFWKLNTLLVILGIVLKISL